jgi:hypothetical protein
MTITLLSLLPVVALATDPSLADTVEHAPALSTDLLGIEVEAPLSTRGRLEVASPYAVDAAGNELSALPGALGVVRAGLNAQTGWFLHPFGVKAALEADAIGSLVNGPDLRGSGLPYENGGSLQLRQAWVGAGFAYMGGVAAGAMTSHWGLGLVANDGAHGWEPGNAQFNDPVSGDRVLRAAVTSGPWPEFWGVKAALAVDRGLGDDMMLWGDTVYQAVAALSIGEDKPHGAGFYVVRRHAQTLARARTDVWVVDGTARTEWNVLPSVRLFAAAESAFIFGDTTMAPSTAFPTHDVVQLGAVLRAGADFGKFGFIADGVYASGDQNLNDRAQNGFRTDINFQQGLLLFRHVIAGQTGRGVAVASNPEITGKPAQDIERFATRGAVSNAWVFFPRGWFRPMEGLEIYGGPLLAISDVPLIDPYNTRMAGGSLRNALDDAPGAFLGTELDLGVRYRADLGPVQMTAGVEGGALLPGDALGTAPILGTRMLLELRL